MDSLASYCLTEAGSGSDAASLKTTARQDGEEYVLNGKQLLMSMLLTVTTTGCTLAQAASSRQTSMSCFVNLCWSFYPSRVAHLDQVPKLSSVVVG